MLSVYFVLSMKLLYAANFQQSAYARMHIIYIDLSPVTKGDPTIDEAYIFSVIQLESEASGGDN